MAPTGRVGPTDSTATRKGKKQANFSNIEIEQIARSWLACSTCSAVGAQQKSEVYWNKIEQHFQKAMTEFRRKYPGVVPNVVRSLRSLGSKWGDINHDCAKFSGCLSTVIELHESGTSYEEQLEKARALYQQTEKKGQEFAFEGAWTILKDSPKWQTAARMNEKHLERAAKRKKAQSVQGDSSQDQNGNSATPPTPEMVTDRPMGNKKAKELAAIEGRTSKNKSALADSTAQIAAALNRRAQTMEAQFELQLFSVNLGNLDPEARKFMMRKRQMAEWALAKQLKTVEPWTDENVNLPRGEVQTENTAPNENFSPDENVHVGVESEDELEEGDGSPEQGLNASNPPIGIVPDSLAQFEASQVPGFARPHSVGFQVRPEGVIQYKDLRALYKFM